MHPYTIGLIEAVPKLDSGARWLTMIPGRIPDPQEAIRGCRFGPRCAFARANCRTGPP